MSHYQHQSKKLQNMYKRSDRALEDTGGPLRCQCTNLTSNEVTGIYPLTSLVIGCRLICRLVVCQFQF